MHVPPFLTLGAPALPQVGPDDHVICALSGGVDSTVAATLVHKVLGDRLHCVFVDNGLLRYNVSGVRTLGMEDGERQMNAAQCAIKDMQTRGQ